MKDQKLLLMQKCGEESAYYGDLVNRLIRERYSLSEELSLLRRREECPEEFLAYTEYAEACKRKAKEKLGGSAI